MRWAAVLLLLVPLLLLSSLGGWWWRLGRGDDSLETGMAAPLGGLGPLLGSQDTMVGRGGEGGDWRQRPSHHRGGCWC